MKAIIKQSREGDLYQVIELVEDSGEKTKIKVSSIEVEIYAPRDFGALTSFPGCKGS